MFDARTIMRTCPFVRESLHIRPEGSCDASVSYGSYKLHIAESIDSWLPSAGSIPASTYSLDKLLTTPFPGIELIPDDRYVRLRGRSLSPPRSNHA